MTGGVSGERAGGSGGDDSISRSRVCESVERKSQVSATLTFRHRAKAQAVAFSASTDARFPFSLRLLPTGHLC